MDFQYSQTREGTADIKILKHLEFFLKRGDGKIIQNGVRIILREMAFSKKNDYSPLYQCS
ncbi:hypothetical protein KUTeg_018302 [Tegillarca granosa]|uniref:Uncharacterized protein n=1 Tax=Tegillarca granosa TaxID=220873 RepID=A0ABQ9EHG8_TEGGR|nr:hypothetical protein KUTeg_018302 [Tegillarca granosa]